MSSTDTVPRLGAIAIRRLIGDDVVLAARARAVTATRRWVAERGLPATSAELEELVTAAVVSGAALMAEAAGSVDTTPGSAGSGDAAWDGAEGATVVELDRWRRLSSSRRRR